MGAVYLAARADEQYQKRVAIKGIKAGLDRDEVVARFRRTLRERAGRGVRPVGSTTSD